jgi:hypothetical protein
MEDAFGRFVPVSPGGTQVLAPQGTPQHPIVLGSPYTPAPTTPGHPINLDTPSPLAETPIHPRQLSSNFAPSASGRTTRAQASLLSQQAATSSAQQQDDDEDDGLDLEYTPKSPSRRGSGRRRRGRTPPSSSSESSSGSEGSSSGSNSPSPSDGSESSSSDESSKPKHRQRSNIVVPPPKKWYDGEAPAGGYYRDTFIRVHTEWASFKRAHGSQGYTFKDLIQACIAPMIRRQLKLSEREWKNIDDRDLIKLLKEKLEFKGADFYLRKLEHLEMEEGCHEPAANLLPAFIRFTTPFLKIIDDAAINKVKLTHQSIMTAFKDHIKDYPSLKRWFASEKFKEIGDAVSFITDKIKERMETEEQSMHDKASLAKSSAGAAGVRQDFQGGKAEPGIARGRDAPKSGGIKKKDHSKSSDITKKAFDYEKGLSKGMYWHCKIGRCKQSPCSAKFCQGCGWHAFGSKGHSRPHCPNKKHPDFVAKGYYHDKFPGREDSIVSKNLSTPPKGDNSATREREQQRTLGSEHGARVRGVKSRDEESN